MNVLTAPCSTSLIILQAASYVQTLRCSGSYSSAMNSATSPITSSNTYDFAMHASGSAMLFTNIFNTLFIRYTLYFYHVCTGPHSFNSSTICTTRCDIISKNLIGIWISNINIIIAMSFLRLDMSLGSMTLIQILPKTRDNLIIAIRDSHYNKPFMQNDSNWCITTCQSCPSSYSTFLVIRCLAIAP